MEQIEPKLLDAKLAAHKLLNHYAISEPEEIDLCAMCGDLGIALIAHDLEGCQARLVRKGNRGIVRYCKTIPELGKIRFTIGHEMGHWFLHGNAVVGTVCTSDDIDATSGGDRSRVSPEIEASVFASELLMPTGMFRRRANGTDPGFAIIKHLSEVFSTTLTATAARFVETTNDSCLVVFSNNGRVKWWRRSDSCTGLYLESQQPIDIETKAGHCFQGVRDSGPMQRVDFYRWFSHVERHHIPSVYEQSIKLGDYDSVLTILWIEESAEEF